MLYSGMLFSVMVAIMIARAFEASIVLTILVGVVFSAVISIFVLRKFESVMMFAPTFVSFAGLLIVPAIFGDTPKGDAKLMFLLSSLVAICTICFDREDGVKLLPSLAVTFISFAGVATGAYLLLIKGNWLGPIVVAVLSVAVFAYAHFRMVERFKVGDRVYDLIRITSIWKEPIGLSEMLGRAKERSINFVEEDDKYILEHGVPRQFRRIKMVIPEKWTAIVIHWDTIHKQLVRRLYCLGSNTRFGGRNWYFLRRIK
jgi:hypothetical protein